MPKKVDEHLNGQLCGQLGKWMSNLRTDIRDSVPIKNLTIPGAFHSMTFGETDFDGVDNGNDCNMGLLAGFFPDEVNFWLDTRKQCISEQLHMGIRFFGFHITRPTEIHENQSLSIFDQAELEPALLEIRSFLNEHPKEFVILDFQRFDNMLYSNHMSLQSLLQRNFGDILLTRLDGSLKRLTLSKALEKKKQIMVVYRRTPAPHIFWQGHHWPISSPRTTTEYLNFPNFLQKSLLSRDMDKGHVIRYTMDPETPYSIINYWRILVAVSSSIENDASRWLAKRKLQLVNAQWENKINILMVDNSNLMDTHLPESIISLNNYFPFPSPIIEPGQANENRKSTQSSKDIMPESRNGRISNADDVTQKRKSIDSRVLQALDVPRASAGSGSKRSSKQLEGSRPSKARDSLQAGETPKAVATRKGTDSLKTRSATERPSKAENRLGTNIPKSFEPFRKKLSKL